MVPSAGRAVVRPAPQREAPPRILRPGGRDMRIVVTGGSGKGGAWVVRDLREHGHEVLNVDTRHDGSAFGLCLLTDLTDLGQTQEALSGADAVVHFAAIPAPQLRPEGETFRNN